MRSVCGKEKQFFSGTENCKFTIVLRILRTIKLEQRVIVLANPLPRLSVLSQSWDRRNCQHNHSLAAYCQQMHDRPHVLYHC